MKKRNLIVLIILFAFIAVTFCSPIYRNFQNWGQKDWDESFFWNDLARKTILEYHQFPRWNSYSRGGMEFLGYPHSSFLSPMFLWVIVFGVNAGLKIQIIVYLFFGLIGMYALSRFLALSRISACLSAFVYNLSSIYVLHLAEGHTGWMAMELLPWFFLAYLKSLQSKKWIVIAGAIFALFLACGSVDVTSITIVFMIGYAFFISIQGKRLEPFLKIMCVFLWSGLLMAVKILPMLRFLSVYTKQFIEVDGIGIQKIGAILLSKSQSSLYDLTIPELGMKYAWHEYGAYIGIIPLILAAIGLLSHFKKFWPLICMAVICFFLAMGNKSVFPLWELLTKLPIYSSLRVPSRYILGFVFCAALFSGLGLDFLKKLVKIQEMSDGQRIKRVIFFSIILFVVGDLFMVNSPIWKRAFVFPPKHIEQKSPFLQSRSNLVKSSNKWSDLYPSFLANRGIIDSNEIMHIESHVAAQGDLNYRGEVYLANANGYVNMRKFTLNSVAVEIRMSKDDILVLNQNYYRGWKVLKGNKISSAINYNGLLSSDVNQDVTQVTFFYLPNDFIIGLIISFLSILCTVYFLTDKNIFVKRACAKHYSQH